MDKIQKQNLIAGIIFAGFIIAVIYHLFLGHVVDLSYPYNTFLFEPHVRFSDHFNIYNIFPQNLFNPYNQSHFPCVNYPPFGTGLQYLLTKIPSFLSFIIFLLISLIYFSYYNYKNLKFNSPKPKLFNFITFTFLSYPFLICMDRANWEMLIFILIALFVDFFKKEKYFISSILLAFAAAIKIYPIIFIALFLSRKKIKEALFCCFAAVLLNFISLLFMEGSIISNLHYYSKQMSDYIYQYGVLNGGLGWGSSLFGIVKIILFNLAHSIKPVYYQINNTPFTFTSFMFLNDNFDFSMVQKALKIFSPIATGLIGLTGLYVIFKEKELWKQTLLLFISAIIFAPISGDYKMLSLFIPMWLFINSSKKSKLDLIYAILFGLILIPKSYIQFFNTQGYNHFSSAIILNPFLLTTFWSLVFFNNKKELID